MESAFRHCPGRQEMRGEEGPQRERKEAHKGQSDFLGGKMEEG